MTLKKYMKSRFKYKILLLSFVVALIALTVIFFQIGRKPSEPKIELSSPTINIGDEITASIVVEKYNQHSYRMRVIKDKIKYLMARGREVPRATKPPVPSEVTNHVHIFYTTHINWTVSSEKNKSNRSRTRMAYYEKEHNTRYFPFYSYYTLSEAVISAHFRTIKECGIGVIVITKTPRLTRDLFSLILLTAQNYKVAIATEVVLQTNETTTAVVDHLHWLNRYKQFNSIYKVFSISRNESVPLVYVKNASILRSDDKFFCANKKSTGNEAVKAVLIGHIETKNHAELMRRLCFDGFYPRVPSNGLNFASTWKNWSYLKTFAQTYKMLWVPTVGPGYEYVASIYTDRQKQRSGGRYYGVSWRTAISTYIGFISISSYNDWEEGSQIEEAKSFGPFKGYTGSPKAYLDMTTYWVENFLKTARQSQNSCYELLNNTIC